MITYTLSALALKVFSYNAHTMKLYRTLCNIIGNKKRQNQDIDTYVQRGNLLLALCNKYGPLKHGSQLLEIGTGWIHWYSIYLRLFLDSRITMLDIWDNRQLEALRSAFSKLKLMSMDTLSHEPMLEDLTDITEARSFDDLYKQLNLAYIIDEQGSLSRFPDNSFDLVFSFHVLEHVPAENISALAGDIHRLLKPGGLSIHQIGIDDHLSHYDKAESPKKYLEFSDQAWERFFQNKVQYFNRLQVNDFSNSFDQYGFEHMASITETTDISSLLINSKYHACSDEDLKCTIATLVHKKRTLL